MQQEMAAAAAGWMQGPLFELDVGDMQAQVCARVVLGRSCWLFVFQIN